MRCKCAFAYILIYYTCTSNIKPIYVIIKKYIRLLSQHLTAVIDCLTVCKKLKIIFGLLKWISNLLYYDIYLTQYKTNCVSRGLLLIFQLM